MRTTIRLEDDLVARAKQLAAKTGRTLTAVIEDALRAALAMGRPPGGRKPIELPTFGRGGLLPGVDLDASAALLGGMGTQGEPD